MKYWYHNLKPLDLTSLDHHLTHGGSLSNETRLDCDLRDSHCKVIAGIPCPIVWETTPKWSTKTTFSCVAQFPYLATKGYDIGGSETTFVSLLFSWLMAYVSTLWTQNICSFGCIVCFRQRNECLPEWAFLIALFIIDFDWWEIMWTVLAHCLQYLSSLVWCFERVSIN